MILIFIIIVCCYNRKNLNLHKPIRKQLLFHIISHTCPSILSYYLSTYESIESIKISSAYFLHCKYFVKFSFVIAESDETNVLKSSTEIYSNVSK